MVNKKNEKEDRENEKEIERRTSLTHDTSERKREREREREKISHLHCEWHVVGRLDGLDSLTRICEGDCSVSSGCGP